MTFRKAAVIGAVWSAFMAVTSMVLNDVRWWIAIVGAAFGGVLFTLLFWLVLRPRAGADQQPAARR